MRHQLLLGRERVLLALDQLEQLLPAMTSETVAAVVDARWNYARLVLAHLDREEDHVFTPLEGDERPAAIETLARFRADRARISAGLQGHARRYWSDEDMAADPDGYRASLIPLLAQVRAMLLAETRDLYPFLDGVDPRKCAPPERPSRIWAADIGKYRSAAPAARSLGATTAPSGC